MKRLAVVLLFLLISALSAFAQNNNPCSQVLNAATTGQVPTATGPGQPPPCQWQTPSSGSGNVTGPSSAVSGNCASFNGTTGKIIQDSGQGCGGTANVTYCSGSASATAAICTGTPAPSTYTALTGSFAAGATSTGAPLTLNINSLGVKNVYLNGSATSSTNNVVNGQVYSFTYDGIEIQLSASLGTSLPSGTTATTQSPLTNNTTVATTHYVDAAVAAGGGGISPVYDTATSGQTGNLGAVTMVTPGANHDYLFTWTVELSVAGTSCTGSTTVTLNAIFQSLNGSGSTTEVLGILTIANAGVGTVGFVAEGSDNIIAKSGTAVQFSTSGYTLGASCSGTNPTYIVYPTLVQLW